MATKPTKLQQQARDQIAESLLLITGAARLDGRGTLDANLFAEIAARIARVSSGFTLDEILVRALERRGQSLGLPASAAEMLTLIETDVRPLEMLLLDDEEFRALIARVEEEL